MYVCTFKVAKYLCCNAIRATLELKVRHRIEEVKDLYETVSSRFREKNKEMKFVSI